MFHCIKYKEITQNMTQNIAKKTSNNGSKVIKFIMQTHDWDNRIV